MTASKIVAAAASGVSTDKTHVEDVFATRLWDGNGSASDAYNQVQVAENGIALGTANVGGSLDFKVVSSYSGDAGNWVTLPASSDFGFGTGDFTIEMFVYIEKAYNYAVFMDTRPKDGSASNDILFYHGENGQITFSKGDGNIVQSSSGDLNAGSWNHLALVRSSGTTKIYVDGTSVGSASDSTNYRDPSTIWSIGGSYHANAYTLDGYLSNVRIVKGTAVYTGNFTAPTAALTDVTNTKVLFAQGDDPFTDNSSNSVTITNADIVLASKFGPFAGSDAKGGMVWIKARETSSEEPNVHDTVRGTGQRLMTHNTSANSNETQTVKSFHKNGFIVGDANMVNSSSYKYNSWTWAINEKFFDIVTYSGQDTDLTITHGLKSVPGMVWVKRTDTSGDWYVYHRSINQSENLVLNSGGDVGGNNLWTSTTPTATQFTLAGNNTATNKSGGTYVAYFFAHNNSDGVFGETGDQDIIKCGEYNGDATSQEISLGFEPQWLMIKCKSTSSTNWSVFDHMRVWRRTIAQNNDSDAMYFNVASAEGGVGRVYPTPDGFGFQQENNNTLNASGQSYVYMAIRRSTKEPTAGTDVFSIDTQNSNPPYFDSNHIVDMAIVRSLGSGGSGGSGASNYARIIGEKYLKFNGTNAEANASEAGFDFMNGHIDQNYGGTNTYSWMWKRSTGYFDVTTHKGTGSAKTVPHNLGVVPEMIWIKRRDSTDNWCVFHKDVGATKHLALNSDNDANTSSTRWNDTAPTASVFTVGTDAEVNGSGGHYVGYHFATVDGVSKVGSYTGDGSAGKVIDCGFSNGARFVLIKELASSHNWYVWDTLRGIVSGNDPYFLLDTNDSENDQTDSIDPNSSGFAVNYANTNSNGQTYIFYAIA